MLLKNGFICLSDDTVPRDVVGLKAITPKQAFQVIGLMPMNSLI